MWTSKISAVKRIDKHFLVTVAIINGDISVSEDYVLNGTNLEGLKDKINNTIKVLEDAETLAKELTAQIDQTFDLTPITPTPTQSELDKKSFFNDVQALRKMQTAVNLGIKTGRDLDYLALSKKVKTDFKSEYLDEI